MKEKSSSKRLFVVAAALLIGAAAFVYLAPVWPCRLCKSETGAVKINAVGFAKTVDCPACKGAGKQTTWHRYMWWK